MIAKGLNVQEMMQFPAPPPPMPTAPAMGAMAIEDEDFKRRFGVDRLRRAISASRQGMEKFLQVRKEVIQQIAGKLSDNQQNAYPVNKLAFMYNTLLRFLVPGNIKCLVTAKAPQVEGAAKALQQVLNQMILKGNMKDVVRRCISESLVGTGFSKVGWGDEMTPCLSAISMDDIFYDVAAQSWDEITFVGHKYLCNVDMLAKFSTNNPQFDQDAIAQLMISYGTDGVGEVQHGTGYGANWQNSAQDVFYSSMDDMRRQRMERLVRLYDVYIPEHKITVTICDDVDAVLRVRENKSGDCPYDQWILEHLPGTTLSGGPCARLSTLNRHYQNVYIQNAASASAAKTVGMYPKGKQDEAGALSKAGAGTWVPVTNPADPKVITFPGVDGMMQAYAMQVDDVFNKLSGNIDALAGVGTEAPTLGQDELIAASSSRAVDFMMRSIYENIAKILKKMAWMIWHESEQTYNYTEKMDVFGEKVDVSMAFAPGHREYDYDTIDVEIAPYAEVVRTPSERLRDLTGVFTQFVIPLQASLMAQGKMVDVVSFMARVAEYSDLPELQTIIVDIPPEMLMAIQEGAGGGGNAEEDQSAAKPAETTRNYVRRSEGRNDSGTQREKLLQSKGKPNTAGSEKA